MQHGQHVDIAFGRQRVNDQIGQAHHGKLPRALNLARPAEHRKRPEHHGSLDDPADDPLRRARIILRDPVADRLQVAARLRREVNVQA